MSIGKQSVGVKDESRHTALQQFLEIISQTGYGNG